MNGLRHPFTGDLYEQDGNGNIRVVARVVGTQREGLFSPDGRWISGDIREADPQLCNWVAGPMVGKHRLTRTSPS